MDTDFKKNDGGKPRWTMVPFVAVDKVVGVLEYGAGKYGKDNWKKGCDYSRLMDATMRHLMAWWNHEELDTESGKSHLAHAACNILFLLYFQIMGIGNDDR
mgnify:FL=1|tara:strand:+ start:2146 stop:2448 length:303 start_codon:yes stop_codon:yes gene_type:complete